MSAIRTAALAAASALGLGGAYTLVDKHEWTGRETAVYRDPVGIPTICIGHTGPLTKIGRRATPQECTAAALKDLEVAYATVQRCVKVPLTDGEKQAWTSFTFNVGPGAKGVKDGMCMLKNGNLPTHVKLLNAGKPKEACAMLMQWTKAGGVQYRGLVTRRIDEVTYCLKDLK